MTSRVRGIPRTITKIDGRITYDLIEMLQLRGKGWSYQELAVRYERERTTLLHQGKKWGVEVGCVVVADPDGFPVVIGFDDTIIDKNKRVAAPILKKTVNEMKGKKIPVKISKYQHLFEDQINPGKSYAQYVKEAKKRPLEGRYMREHRLDWRVV